jgi:hypothetical protein
VGGRAAAEALLGDQCAEPERTRGEPRLRQCARELAEDGDQVGVRRQCRPVGLGLRDLQCLPVEGGEAGDRRVDEGVEFRVGQGPGDSSTAFGQVGVMVGAGQERLQRAVAADGSRESLAAASAGAMPMPTSVASPCVGLQKVSDNCAPSDIQDQSTAKGPATPSA